ncbi:hypothetical protein F511_10956 [Dorcoceras hygrometricum]|uniref:Uncharacterized protein n=1 Tax=Dorcoceras hygrometricum TaxID=472368 RepID=A0A2Z7A8A7_9LAMI|nr:hypothetical protein F511_10956 [Dorcoceras hygrometricum]
MRKHNPKPSSFDSLKKNFNSPSDDKCYNIGRPGYFMADCRKPSPDAKKQPDHSTSKDKTEKKLSRKRRMEKAMVVEENKSAWADSDSEESNSGTSSSSESEDEVQCLMADDTNEVLDFSNLEFTREDLVTTLNYMVQEYKNLSQLFEEIKAEKESCANKAELESSSDMKAALSKLATENDELRSRSEEMLYENQRLAGIISSWTRSYASLHKLHGAVKSSGDKIGLGYNGNESSTAEPSCTTKLFFLSISGLGSIAILSFGLELMVQAVGRDLEWE